MLELCLFDLDNTLIRTDDLKDIREACANNSNPARLRALVEQIRQLPDRRIYSHAFLRTIRQRFPGIKLGVFTRAPRSYVNTVLDWAYPGFIWDVIIAYEDVRPTKPYGDGVLVAMQHLQLHNPSAVALIGDTDVDVKAAYNSGCLVAVDTQAWPYRYLQEHWRALELVPDAFIEGEADVLAFLAEHRQFLPNMECLIESAPRQRVWRYDKIGYFMPRPLEDGGSPYQIHVAGRSFSNHGSVNPRHAVHALTASIGACKDVVVFPPYWIETIRNFINLNFDALFGPKEVVVTVVPHRPDRQPRLERLLEQLAASFAVNPLEVNVTCVPDLLAYTNGVRSNHNEFLNRAERFENVREHLIVNRPDRVERNKAYVVVDDVVTTGASLIYAERCLKAAGAGQVMLLGLSKNIGDIYAYL
ncbi:MULTISPECIES: HAD family hydrolase [Achromobacter]|uniref:HAD family hydrolase n=1 Tax=Achromobacter TaxID=222 RepID=UPI0025C150B3|nr:MULTISPECIES: HAD hydrolase-like protein [Achromobacter]